MADPAVVITGTGLVCPAAASAGELVAAPVTTVGWSDGWFDPVPDLGRHGWKYLSPATRFVLAAASRALADAGLPTDPRALAAAGDAGLPGATTGVVIGTNFAAARPLARFDQTVLDEGANALSPAEAPTFSVNIPASQVSLRYGLRAFNLSLTNPVVAGIEAMLTLASAIRSGRAAAGVAGATEQQPDLPGAHPVPGEGACCFVLEPSARARARAARPAAELAGGFSRFLPGGPEPPPPGPKSPQPGSEPPPPGREPSLPAGAGSATGGRWAAALGRPLARLLAGSRGKLPVAVLPGRVPAGPLLAYCAAVCEPLGVELVGVDYPGADGSMFTVSPLLAVAGLIEEHRRGLVLCASGHGHIAAAYLRPPDLPGCPPAG